MMLTKQDLRMQLAREYASCDLALIVPTAVAHVRAHPAFVRARDVLVYEPLPDEIPFIDELMESESEKLYYFPNTTTAWFQDADEHPWEPRGNTCVLVPARACDARGNRLGRGGGWYDRVLASLSTDSGVHTMSVIPAFALCDTIPTENHDVAVDDVIVIDAA